MKSKKAYPAAPAATLRAADFCAAGALDGLEPPSLTRELLDAYRNTRYVVHAAPDYSLEVGKICDDARATLKNAGAQRALLITACNPFSTELPGEINRQRMAWLDETLTRRGLKSLPAAGEDPSGRWPPEESRLVLGISDQNVIDLLVLAQQHAAILVLPSGAVCLVLHPVDSLRERRRPTACRNSEQHIRFDRKRDEVTPASGPDCTSEENDDQAILCRIVPHNGGIVAAYGCRARNIAAIHRAIDGSRTWAEFRAAAPADAYSEITMWVEELEGAKPRGKQSFDAESVPGWSDGSYPPWLQPEMVDILPLDLLECYGKDELTHVNGSYFDLPGEHIEAFVADLQALGWIAKIQQDLKFH